MGRLAAWRPATTPSSRRDPRGVCASDRAIAPARGGTHGAPMTRMTLRPLALTLTLSLSPLACETHPPDTSEELAAALTSRPSFENAVVREDCPDPGVVRVDTPAATPRIAFYMTCTGGRFAIRRSTDLVKWTDTGEAIFPDGKPPWASDGNRNWAPEIHELGPASFVAYYTASDEHHKLAIGVAYAPHPLGPWTDRGRPLVQHAIGVIDATFFADDDGKNFLYWKVDGNQRGLPTPIMVQELGADGRSFAPRSSPVEVLTNDASSWEGPVVEAPWIVKRDGAYFMFYAGNVYDDRYRTGVARAPSPTARFTKSGSPILANNAKWVGPGHGSVVRAGATDWFVHHAWTTDASGQINRGSGRQVLLDAIVWKRDGWPSFAGGSSAIGPGPLPSP